MTYSSRRDASTASVRRETSNPTVWACIAVFNRVQFTRTCLNLLQNQTYPEIRPVVVDDGSNDGTAEMVTSEHPEAVLLRGDGNLYWTGAMHRGMSHILSHAGPDDYVLLLNDDLVFEPNLVESMLECSKAHPRSLIQAIESCTDDPDIIWNGGVCVNWWTAKHLRINYGRRISEFPADHIQRSDYVTGRGVLVPIQIFRDIGNYNLSYKQYGDPELARRAARKGYDLFVTYKSRVLSYEKGKNLNEAAVYLPADFRRYYFGRLSSARVTLRWQWAMDMTDSALQALVFFACDFVRVTWHFVKRLRFASPAI